MITNPFKIKVVHDYAFIELTRELVLEDFISAQNNADSINFIFGEDYWRTSDENSDRTKEPYFSACYRIKLKWVSSLRDDLETISSNRNSKFLNSQALLHTLVNLSSIVQSNYFRHTFNWKGCNSPESRKKKLEKARNNFDTIFQQEKLIIEGRALYDIKRRVESTLKENHQVLAKEIFYGCLEGNFPFLKEEDIKDEEVISVSEEISSLDVEIKRTKELLSKLEGSKRNKTDTLSIFLIEKAKNNITKEEMTSDTKSILIKEIEIFLKKGQYIEKGLPNYT